MDENTLIEVQDIKKYFPIEGGFLRKTIGYVRAVDGVSLSIKKGETLGLVGESGCGKSTMGRVILRLLDATSGQVIYKGKDLNTCSEKEMRKLRKNLQIVFQDPYGSLNPRKTVLDIIGGGLKNHGITDRKEREERVVKIMDAVGLSPTAMRKYPHEFSGGQRQRISLARALVLEPEFIVCDEPVSALDVSIQAQIINLMEDLQQEFNLTYLFIAHDLSVVRHISDRIAVMYLGKIVEIAPEEELFSNPVHPYTTALLSAVPVPNPKMRHKERILLEGDVPSPANPPTGCRFHTRCAACKDICMEEEPTFKEVGAEHYVACHLA